MPAFFGLPIIPLSMTAVLQSPSHVPSSPSSQLSRPSNDALQTLLTQAAEAASVGREERERESVSVFDLVVAVLRRSLAQCRAEWEVEVAVEEEKGRRRRSMEIGWPTEVRHVAHVTFDRFNGFLGLPVEFEPEVPRRAPSARSFFLSSLNLCELICFLDSKFVGMGINLNYL